MTETIEPRAVGHGARVRRLEDPTLVRGARAYTDDLRRPDARHAVFVRAGLAHARILSIEVEEALAAPGAVAVYTAADLDLAPFPAAAPPDATPESMRRPILAADTVRFIGEPVAIVIADTRAHAVDASELVFVDYEPLDVLVDPARALDPGAPRLFDDGNLAARSPRSQVTLDDAEVVVGRRYVNQRVAAVPLEPGAALAAPDPDAPGSYILWTPSQGVHNYQATISGCLRMEPERLRVVTPATGGGFGARIAAYPEMVAIVAAAR